MTEAAQRLPRAQHPYALFFGQRRGGANRTQGDFITGAFQFQRVARPEVQFISEWDCAKQPTQYAMIQILVNEECQHAGCRGSGCRVRTALPQPFTKTARIRPNFHFAAHFCRRQRLFA